MDSRVKEILNVGNRLFSKKTALDSLRQEIATFYYFERADFTTKSTLGTDYASGAMTSFPHLARRELAGLFPALLRTGNWFSAHIKDRVLDEDLEVRRWLEGVTETQMRAMRDSDSGFLMAAGELDNDFVTFGDGVISVEVDLAAVTLLYRTWHPRDCVWTHDERRKTDALWRKWKAPLRVLKRKFRNLHREVVKRCEKEPEAEIDCQHMVVRREDFDLEGKSPNAKFMSFYVDIEHEHVMEQTPVSWFPYVVPIWGSISSSQYGYSPAVVLPDARSADVVRRVLLDAGESAVNPPMVAVQDAIRSDIALYPGGITFADVEYDERLGEVLRPITRDSRNLPFGKDMEDLFQETIANSFFLNKLILPPARGEKTAFEIAKRVQEHVRASSALFDPVDAQYSSPLCETTFDALMSVGTFGARDRYGAIADAPEAIAGKSIEYDFVNPIRDAEKEAKAARFTQGLQIADAVGTIDPAQIANINMTTAFRESLKGIGWPATWLENEEAVEQARVLIEQKQQVEDGAAALQTGADIAQTGGQAAKALSDAGVELG